MATSERFTRQRLLIRPRPLQGEGLWGYLLRVSELNGIGHLSWIRPPEEGQASLLARPPLGAHRYQHLAECLELDSNVLERLGYPVTDAKEASVRQLDDHCVPRGVLRHLTPAVCPHCLAEQAVIPAIWELKLVVTCTRHRCWLVDVCARCKAPLRPNRRGVRWCDCGADLARAPAPQPPVPACLLALTAIIENLAYPMFQGARDAAAEFPSQLDAASLWELTTFNACVVTRLSRERRVLASDFLIGTSELNSDAQCAALMAALLARWPHGLRAVLCESPDDSPSQLSWFWTLTGTHFAQRTARFKLLVRQLPSWSRLRRLFEEAYLAFEADLLRMKGCGSRYCNPEYWRVGADGRPLYSDRVRALVRSRWTGPRLYPDQGPAGPQC